MKKKYKVLIIIAVVLIVFRLILPFIVLHYANKTLSNMPGYYGHIDDIDISLILGAYEIKDIFINKLDSATQKESDFFNAKSIDLSIAWPALFKGSIVGELDFHSPTLVFIKTNTALQELKADTTDFRNLLKSFMPLKVNKVAVDNGTFIYKDFNTKPNLDLKLTNASVLALNLTNVVNEDVKLPSTLTAKADIYDGIFILNMQLNALAETPTFDLNASLKNTHLPKLNDFFKAYGHFDVTDGDFSLYTELAAADGAFVGYLKPIIVNLNVVGPEDKEDPILQKIWEHTVGGLGAVLKNQRENQVATKVDMNGTFDNPDISGLEVILQVLRNAFIQALLPTIDNEINIKSVNDDEQTKRKPFWKRKAAEKQ
ncbi:MAG: DUF748 domain-containing protein [Chitinophagales bacterium]